MNSRQDSETLAPTKSSEQPSLGDYLSLARFDHVTKHVFIIPGVVLAYMFAPSLVAFPILSIIIGFTSAILIASGNYVINEWLDRSFDAFHPVKSQRPSVARSLSPTLVYTEYLALIFAGLFLAYQIGGMFIAVAIAFVLSGVVYNVEPMRTKDKVYVDVISESVNSPLRLALGWTMVDPMSFPPISLLIAFWFGGAFLMTAKRLAEYRRAVAGESTQSLHLYRKSFRQYTTDNLTMACFLYAILSAFFIAVFLIKYRIEYLLAFPFVAALFAMYFWLALQPGTAVERPERLFKSRRLMLTSGLTVLAVIAATFIDVPQLEQLSGPFIIDLR